MHPCFVFRGTPGLFRAGPPLPQSPSLFQNSPDLFYTPDLASADFHGLPYSSDPFGLLPLAIFGLPHPSWLSQASRPLPITSDTSPTSAGLVPAPQTPFAPRTFCGSFPTAPSPFSLPKFYFFFPWLPLKRKVAATPLLTSPRLLIHVFRHLPTLSCTFLGLPLRSLGFRGSPAYSDPFSLRFSRPALRFALLKHFRRNSGWCRPV